MPKKRKLGDNNLIISRLTCIVHLNRCSLSIKTHNYSKNKKNSITYKCTHIRASSISFYLTPLPHLSQSCIALNIVNHSTAVIALLIDLALFFGHRKVDNHCPSSTVNSISFLFSILQHSSHQTFFLAISPYHTMPSSFSRHSVINLH